MHANGSGNAGLQSVEAPPLPCCHHAWARLQGEHSQGAPHCHWLCSEYGCGSGLRVHATRQPMLASLAKIPHCAGCSRQTMHWQTRLQLPMSGPLLSPCLPGAPSSPPMSRSVQGPHSCSPCPVSHHRRAESGGLLELGACCRAHAALGLRDSTLPAVHWDVTARACAQMLCRAAPA